MPYKYTIFCKKCKKVIDLLLQQKKEYSMERWLSGWRHRSRKAAWAQAHRGFKSLPFRISSKRVFGATIRSARSAGCFVFPLPNPVSASIFHAPRGSKKTVRSLKGLARVEEGSGEESARARPSLRLISPQKTSGGVRLHISAFSPCENTRILAREGFALRNVLVFIH